MMYTIFKHDHFTKTKAHARKGAGEETCPRTEQFMKFPTCAPSPDCTPIGLQASGRTPSHPVSVCWCKSPVLVQVYCWLSGHMVQYLWPHPKLQWQTLEVSPEWRWASHTFLYWVRGLSTRLPELLLATLPSRSHRGVNQLTLNFWQPGKKFKLTFCESWGIQGISTQILQFNLHNISLK